MVVTWRQRASRLPLLHLHHTHGMFAETMLQRLSGPSVTSGSVLGQTQTLFLMGVQPPSVFLDVSHAKEAVKLVPYSAAAHDGAFDLLQELPNLYPGGAKWLETRLADVLAGKADCTIAKAGVRPVGILIGTPKGKRRVKLSTIYVHPLYRKRHIARDLMDMHWARWTQQGIDQVTVTVRTTRLHSLQRTLKPYGFDLLAIETNRYGNAQDEAILISALGGS